MASTAFERLEAHYSLRGKIRDFTTMSAQLTSGCSAIIALTPTGEASAPTAAQLSAAKTAYDGIRNLPVTDTGGHTMAAMPNTSLWSEIAAEAAQ